MKRTLATLAAVALAATLAACGGDDEPEVADTPQASEMTEEEKWAAADAEKKAAIEGDADAARAAMEACIASDQSDPDVSAEAVLGISSEQFCEETRADDPRHFDIWYGPGTEAEKMEALGEYIDDTLEED